ncbi:MAG: ABC transporter ATP-binding protein [Eggerthellaceae bacterium]|nr:ABC transporter ATP-binding protein [Eggerthellaceae bacterium]
MEDLSVGYNGRALISDINIDIRKGDIVTLIGPNGAGKSTILKSITRQLALVGGHVIFDSNDLHALSFRELSSRMAVVLTERMKPELMTCHDIVATGRYPYTGRLGILSPEDEDKVDEALARVHASEIGERDFDSISDGQRQRVLLARAICQEPDIIVLDEPTSFLDVRHKLELLSILRAMAKQDGITVIMSLHEIDLAMKVTDKIVCVKGDRIMFYGEPEDIFEERVIRELYDIDKGSFDTLMGSIELPAPKGNPRVFVIAGCGTGIPLYRRLAKADVPFATGILYTNDVDYQVARLLAQELVTEQPFNEISDEAFAHACALVDACEVIVDAGAPVGPGNARLADLRAYGSASGKMAPTSDMRELLRSLGAGQGESRGGCGKTEVR